MKIIVTVSSLILLGACIAGAETFDYEYSAATGLMPQKASPEWVLRHGGGTIQLLHEQLHVDTPVGERNFFVIGNLNEESMGDAEKWNASTGMTTVEFRVRCESPDPSLEIFQVQISDGRLQWRIRFLNNKIFPREVPVDTSEADTYRAVIQNGKLTLSSERNGVLLADVPGNESYAGKPTTSNALLFGSFTPNSQADAGLGTWQLDFIRWTNQEALPDL